MFSLTRFPSALKHKLENGTAIHLDGLLVPSDAAQTYQVAAQAGKPSSYIFALSFTEVVAVGYPMITIPAGINSYGMPYGLGIMHTAWSEPVLVKWGSAIEALVKGRRKPTWHEYGTKNIPVLYED
jgi:amidase